MLEEFKARNQVAYERYDSLTKQEQGIIDRWQALEYRLNPPAVLVSGRQNSKLFRGNDPYRIIDTRQTVGYDKGKESGGNELSWAGYSWAQRNQTKPGTSNAYAEYLAYKQKVQARQQRLALEQALQGLLVQEQAARAVAGQQAFAYNGADGLTSGGYETGDAGGITSAAGTGEILSEGSGGGKAPKRPSWRQSEVDVQKSYPDYETQKSFKNGQEISYGTKGSTRPELYKSGHSIEVKNYKIETSLGQSNLVNNVVKQIKSRTTNLPSGTKQTVIIDVRGQTVSNEVLKSIQNKIFEKCGVDVEIVFKR